MNLLYVGLGGFLGAFCRIYISSLIPFNGGFPLATFCVNCIGSLLFALFLCTPLQNAHRVKLFVTTGFLGSFTTFSAFSYEAITLLQQGLWLLASLYVGGTLIVSCTAVYIVFYLKHRGHQHV